MNTRLFPSYAQGVGAAVSAAALLSSTGCAEAPAVDLALVPDSDVNTTAQLVERVGTILVVLDATEGLYPPGKERADGDVQVKNADADPALELVVTVPVSEARLPRIRVERGGLADVPLEIRAFGVPRDPSEGGFVAHGHAAGARFEKPPAELSIAFDLRPELRPARVEQVLPSDGGFAPGCAVPALVVSFSRPIDGASLVTPGVVTVEPDPGPMHISLDASGLVASIATPMLAGDSSELVYRVRVSADARDRDGGPLDQLASEAGAQPYVGEFALECTPPPLNPSMPCGPELTCPPGNVVCEDGACVPKGCPAACATGRVCDKPRGVCVDDCRTITLLEPCLGGEACDPGSGLCR